jgi:hypothetical protein
MPPEYSNCYLIAYQGIQIVDSKYFAAYDQLVSKPFQYLQQVILEKASCAFEKTTSSEKVRVYVLPAH